MEDNKYYIKTRISTHYPQEVAELKKIQRAELIKKLSEELADRQWITIQFRSQVRNPQPFEDPLALPELISSLEVKPVVMTPVEMKVFTPKYVHVKHVGFWQKLKLAFSKKPVYTEE